MVNWSRGQGGRGLGARGRGGVPYEGTSWLIGAGGKGAGEGWCPLDKSGVPHEGT